MTKEKKHIKKADDENPTFSDVSVLSDELNKSVSAKKKRVKNVSSKAKAKNANASTSPLKPGRTRHFDLKRLNLAFNTFGKCLSENRRSITCVLALIAAITFGAQFTLNIKRRLNASSLWGGDVTMKSEVERLCGYHLPLSFGSKNTSCPLMCAFALIANAGRKGFYSLPQQRDKCDERLFDWIDTFDSVELKAQIDSVCHKLSIDCRAVRSDVDAECGPPCESSRGVRLRFAADKLAASFRTETLHVASRFVDKQLVYNRPLSVAYALHKRSGFLRHLDALVGAAVIAEVLIGPQQTDWVATERSIAKTLLSTLTDGPNASDFFAGSPLKLYWATRVESYCSKWYGSNRKLAEQDYHSTLDAFIQVIQTNPPMS